MPLSRSALTPSPAGSRPWRLQGVVALAVGLFVVLTGCGASSPAGGSSFRGDVLAQPVRLPAAGPFVASDGSRPTLPALQTGHLMLVFFGYTHCPDVCPTTMADLGAGLRRSPPAVQHATRVVFITSDPPRDPPAVLRTWLANFDTGLPNPFLGLTGSVASIDAAAQAMGVPLAPPVRAKDGSYTVDHGAQLLAFQNGTARVLWSAGPPPADYTHDLTRLTAGSTS